MNTKYPEVHVEITKMDSNAYSILGSVMATMRRAGIPKEERDAYFEEATSGSYDHLLATTMNWVSVS
jgi:hypothetical protein